MKQGRFKVIDVPLLFKLWADEIERLRRLTQPPDSAHGDHVHCARRSCAAAKAESLDARRVRTGLHADEAPGALLPPGDSV